ncbi:MAG: site-2 protease family protein, partial [Candidatus Kariarchaeaceae archaeon]
MVSLLDVLVGIAAFWLVILFLSSRINFQRYNILVAPLILVWRSERLGNLFNKLFRGRQEKLLSRFGSSVAILYIAFFIVTPLILIINIILALIDQPSELFANNPINFIDSSIVIVFIPIFIAIFIHETAKMIMTAAHGVEIEKAGVMLILIIFAPFVQFGSKSMKLLKRKSRIKILSVGMLSNLVVVILLIPLLANQNAVVSKFYKDPSGAMIISVDPESPVAFDLQQGDVIVGIQRVRLTTIVSHQNISSSSEFISALRNIPSGERFVLVLQGYRLNVQGVDPPEDSAVIAGSYIGVEVFDYRESKYSFFSPLLPFYFEEFLVWSISINLILGVFSVLPLPLSDGSKFLDEMLDGFQIQSAQKSYLKKVAYLISSLLLVANLY